jgi:chromosome segregation ATPase
MAAAFESHLLHDAEVTVGTLAWRDVESIDDLSEEYRELRKIAPEYDRLSGEIESLSQDRDNAHQKRQQALGTISDQTSGKASEHKDDARKLERLTRERDVITGERNTLERRLKGLLTTMEVLTAEQSGTSEMELGKAQTQIEQSEKRLLELESRQETVENEISTLRDEMNRLSDEIAHEEGGTRHEANHHFGQLGSINKDLSTLRNQAGTLESKALPLYGKVGQYLINHAREPAVKKATRKHRSLLKLIALIRKSSHRNGKLQS